MLETVLHIESEKEEAELSTAASSSTSTEENKATESTSRFDESPPRKKGKYFDVERIIFGGGVDGCNYKLCPTITSGTVLQGRKMIA